MARKRKDRFGLGGEVHFQMAPLIDVVFLLLIFFICVTNFDKVEREDLRLAYAETADEYKKGNDTVTVQVRADGTMTVGGLVITKFAKTALQDYFQGLVNASGPNYRVAIRADKRARMKEIKDVYRAAAKAGLTRVTLITETRRRPGEAGAETTAEPEASLDTGGSGFDELLDDDDTGALNE
jgi:biopolymer transport protein ExbD